jgi:hypothetical protein
MTAPNYVGEQRHQGDISHLMLEGPEAIFLDPQQYSKADWPNRQGRSSQKGSALLAVAPVAKRFVRASAAAAERHPVPDFIDFAVGRLDRDTASHPDGAEPLGLNIPD